MGDQWKAQPHDLSKVADSAPPSHSQPTSNRFHNSSYLDPRLFSSLSLSLQFSLIEFWMIALTDFDRRTKKLYGLTLNANRDDFECDV